MRSGFMLLIVFAAAAAPGGESWPQFLGPDGQGHSDATGLPLTWSESQNIAWKTPLPGTGWSSPVVEGRQVWMTTALDDGRSLRALCIDRDSGKLQHNVEVFRVDQPEAINAKNSYASPTSVIEPGRVYVHFGTYGTACLDTGSAKIIWRTNEHKLDHKEGPGSSPMLFGDLLIFNCDGMDVQYVVALDKHTGRIRWKTNRSGPVNANPDIRKAYSTPLVVRVGGHDELVSPGAERTIAYDPQTGKELWAVFFSGWSTVSRPLAGHGFIYLCTGYPRPQLMAIRQGGAGDITESHVAWRHTRQVCKNGTPLLVGDAIYMVDDKGVATCLDAVNGEPLWAERLGGNFSASPIFADGRIYACGEDGRTHVFAPERSFRSLATNQLDGRILATPAIVGRAIFLRTDTHLYRIELSSAMP